MWCGSLITNCVSFTGSLDQALLSVQEALIVIMTLVVQALLSADKLVGFILTENDGDMICGRYQISKMQDKY